MKRFLVLAFLMLIPQFALAQSSFNANSQIAVKSNIIPNNTTAIIIKASPGTVYSIEAFNNSGAIAYIKLYNTATATCGSGTPYARYLIPFGASSAGAGFSVSNINGDSYFQGISMCVTTGIADSDNTAAPANSFIVNVHYQ